MDAKKNKGQNDYEEEEGDGKEQFGGDGDPEKLEFDSTIEQQDAQGDEEEQQEGAEKEPAGGERMTDVISQVTVKALREFSTGNMQQQQEQQQKKEEDDQDRIAAHVQRDQEDKPVGLTPFVYDTSNELPGEDTQDALSCDMDEDDDDDELAPAEGGEVEEFDDAGDGYPNDGDSDDEFEQNELVVLDPEHPLMKRFQLKLREVLKKRNDVLELEVREIREELTNKKKEREDIGVELYGVQQELARYQLTLESLQDSLNELKRNREENEKELEEIRSKYKDGQKMVYSERKRSAELRDELQNISLRLLYLESAKKDVRSDIAVMQRAAEKVEAEVLKNEETKRQQDLFVNRLVERLDRLREDIALFDAQLEAQSAETKAAREALAEARMEIDTISVEKKQLFAAWNSALVGMRRRDEAHSAMEEAMREQQQRIITLEKEIEGFRRMTQKEQQLNEQLTGILNKTDAEIATIKKMIATCQTKFEALKQEFSTYTNILHETEESLNRATIERNQCMTELDELRKETEQTYSEKNRLDDEILERMREQLSADKASQYTERILRQLRERTKELETQIAKAENDIARSMLNNTKAKTEMDQLDKKKNELNIEMQQKDQLVAKIQNEIEKNNIKIKRKTDQMEQLNSRVEKMIKAAGGVELGPLEIQINSLQKSIEQENAAISELQQSWLREQSELVRLSQEYEDQSASVDLMTKQHTILIQKKLRVEAEILSQEGDIVSVERDIHRLQIDLSRLDSLLYKERGSEYQLQQDNQLLETQFMSSLKVLM